MPTAHPSGWAHADGALRGPHWLREPADANDLVDHLWSQTAAKADGVLSVGGVPLPDLVREHGSPAYVLDEADFRARARAFRDAFSDYEVFYAGKAFLCTTVARWLAEEGLSLDVCSGGELAVAERAGFPMERVGFHGNNKSLGELERAVELGVGRVIVDSFHEIERLADVVSRLAGPRTPTTEGVAVMVRVTAGVEAHTHEYIATAHEDQKFGFSIVGGDALEAVRRVHAAPGLRLLGLHSHIGSQIFDTSGFEVAPTPPRTTPPTPPSWPSGCRRSSSTSAGLSASASRGCRSSRAARSSGRRCAPSTRSARSRRSPSTAAPSGPTSRWTVG